MDVQTVIHAIREHDRTVLKHTASQPALAVELERAWANLDTESREMAVAYLTLSDPPNAGTFLLNHTKEEESQVAAEAARGLVSVKNMAPMADLLTAISHQKDEFVRKYLFLAAGNAKTIEKLEALRELMQAEKDLDVKQDALAAVVKLGGQPERAAFKEQVRLTEPDKVIVMCDRLVYIGDKNMAKSLLPWLNRTDAVARLGSDRSSAMSRMCDWAVWTAFQLKVTLPFKPEHLTNFDARQLNASNLVLQALPD